MRTVRYCRVAFTVVALLIFTITAVFAGGNSEVEAVAEPVGFHSEGLPIVDETYTLNFIGMNMNTTRVGRYDETDMMKKLEADTNVKIVWDMTPQASWKEKKNLVIASGELPDGIMGPLSITADEAQLLGGQGVLIPLEGLIAEYAPNIQHILDTDPTYRAQVTSPDGHIYALTAMQDMGFDSLSVSIINKTWLDELGLPVPSTTDEFYETLKAFKENDMAGNGRTIPFSFLYQESADLNREVKREFEWIFLAFGVPETPTHVMIEDNGELIFTASQEGYKEAIKYLHKLYSEGLIDPEVFSQDRTLLTNKIRQMNVGCYTDYRLESSMASEEIQDNYVIMPPLKGPNGDQRWLRAKAGMSDGAFAITSACQHPEIAIRWLDNINTPENSIQMLYGMFKEAGWNQSEALVPSTDYPGKWTSNTDLRPADVNPSDWPWSAPIGSSPVIVPHEVIDEYIAERANNVAKERACAIYRPYLTEYPYNYPFRFTLEEIDELNIIQTDLLNYIYQTVATWIADGGVEEGWDDYLTQLDNLGLQDYMRLYQQAYERSLQ